MTPAKAGTGKSILSIDPSPQFELSPFLYMQFMEPLGTTDSSVEAGWDFFRNCWREDLLATTKELAPPMIRWGGCFSSYYDWKEAVGPRAQRTPVLNLSWGGMETNQIGTHEFHDFCTIAGAEPLLCVNMESDGKPYYSRYPDSTSRKRNAREAAEWVDYCNNPDNAERRKNGFKNPLHVQYWQLGNETSYGEEGVTCFDYETALKKSIDFSKAMRHRDPSIKLIGWGDSGWASRLIHDAGEHIEYIAFHHHFNSGLKNSPLKSSEYRKDPDRTWHHLMNAWKSTDQRLREIKEEMGRNPLPLALTESHFALGGRNRCEVLSSWAAGVANARILNVHERHGDVLKIATLADFFGNRWMVNALIIPTPKSRGGTYMMPVARVMALYRKYSGRQALRLLSVPDGLDVTASRSGNKIFLHVVNTQRTNFVRARLHIQNLHCTSASAYEICEDPEREIDDSCPELFKTVQRSVPPSLQWSFPAASVTALVLEVTSAS